MKRIILLLSLFVALGVSAQGDSGKNAADAFVKRFNLKMDTVTWLCEYDNIAWWTSDSVMATPKEEQAKLGSEWFCFYRNNAWHAVYGKYDNKQFQMVYHYEVDAKNAVRRVNTKVDSMTLNSFSRALANGNDLLEANPDSVKVRFNQYIRRNPDNSISVWFLPAFTTNGIAVYGGEFYYVYDGTGNHLLLRSEYSQAYKGFRPDTKKEIWLSYQDHDEPTLGAVFFVWYYKRYFDRIVIDAKKYKSTVAHDESGYTWIHAIKE